MSLEETSVGISDTLGKDDKLAAGGEEVECREETNQKKEVRDTTDSGIESETQSDTKTEPLNDMSGRRGANKSIIRSQSDYLNSPKRRTIRRTVSFDEHTEAQVRHIPRYNDKDKEECFYNKQDLHRMRFDHQMEKQKAATEAMMKFINMANTELGVPSDEED